MWRLIRLMLGSPLRSIKFIYTFAVQAGLVALKFTLLPHLPHYQSFRTQIQRAYWSSSSTLFPQLIHRLPVTGCPESRARRVGSGWTGYIIPGNTELKRLARPSDRLRCVAVYAHGGGYSRGEARMYLNYMERWQREASRSGLDIIFLSVEYPLTDVAQHPAQQNAFLNAYRYVLSRGVSPSQVIFMGDSAGGQSFDSAALSPSSVMLTMTAGGCCLLSSIELKQLGLPQPAAGVLISPWFDMALKSFQGGCAFVETDYIITANEGVPVFAKRWIGDRDGAAPEVNPLYCEPAAFDGLPPQLVLAGGGDFVLPECQELVQLFKTAELQHRLVVEWGEIHLYALGSKWIAEDVRRRTDSIIFGWIAEGLKTALPR